MRTKVSKEARAGKKAYLSPKLVRYGQVRDLTRSGNLSGNEDTNPSGKCDGSSQNKNRKPCLSDRSAKEQITRIGNHPFGFGLYLFYYKPEYRNVFGHGRQFGVLAQEVERVKPGAVVVHPDGYKMVDYEMLGIEQTRH